MANDTDSGRRGGRRQRHFANKSSLGAIDEEGITSLLTRLAPNASQQRLTFALAIVLKGIEHYREHAPTGKTLTDTVQKNRRAVRKFMNGDTAAGIAPFNSLVCIEGRCFGASISGIAEIPLQQRFNSPYDGLDRALTNRLRAESVGQQLAAGFPRIIPNLPFNGLAGVSESGAKRTVAEVMLDEIAAPPDYEAELAGNVFTAITQGLAIEATTSWFEFEPEKMARGWNFGRLLTKAAAEAGAPIPVGRDGMEGLLKRGKAAGLDLLQPAITYGDGRAFTYFELDFAELIEQRPD